MTWRGVPIPTTDRADWLEKRREGIGASDVAGILGLSPWATPMSVWAEKVEGYEPAENDSMHFGRVLQDVVVDEFAQSNGLHVACQEWLVHHPEHPWAMATLDGLAFDSPDVADHLEEFDIFDPLALVEVKTDGSWSRWDEVPDHYQLQCQWQMFVTGLEHTFIPCLHGGRRFEVYEVDFDPEAVEKIFLRVADFRDRYIVGDEVPDPDGSDVTSTVVKGLYPTADDDVAIEFSKAMAADVDALRAIRLEEKRIAEERKRLENRVKVAMQNASVGLIGGVEAVTYKQITARRVDTKALEKERPDVYEKFVKPSTYRRFTLKEAS